MPSAEVPPSFTVRLFRPQDAAAFRALNEAWITRHFILEESDRITLNDPFGHILEPGGQIVVAEAADEVVGCCALIPVAPGVFELAKMAVAESHRARGIGRKVLEIAIAQARTMGAHTLYLESNSVLANAVHLYESLGFRHIPVDRRHPSAYARADVFMDLKL